MVNSLTITNDVSIVAPELLVNPVRPAAAPQETLMASQPVRAQSSSYSPSLPGYAITQRQQVIAYAVIDSMGRNLTQPPGDRINLSA